jgi:hypothetical protein
VWVCSTHIASSRAAWTALWMVKPAGLMPSPAGSSYRLIHRLGLDDSIYTHISARLPGPEHRFLINPYLARGVDGAVDGEAGRVDAEPGRIVDHLPVEVDRDEVLPLNQWSMQFAGRLAYHAYEGIALDLAERERLVADCSTHIASSRAAWTALWMVKPAGLMPSPAGSSTTCPSRSTVTRLPAFTSSKRRP